MYCGIDIVDSVNLITNARDGYVVDCNGKHHQEALAKVEMFCYCPACTAARSGQGDKFGFEHILTHNYYASLTELGTIRSAIAQGTLRELVDAFAKMAGSAEKQNKAMELMGKFCRENRKPAE